MFTPGRCGPRRPKPESKTEIVEHPYKTLYTPASNLAQRRAKRASSVLLIRLYGRRTAGSTPIKGANVDKRAGTRAMARSTIGSPFLPVEAQETSMNLFPDRTRHESNASDRSLPVVTLLATGNRRDDRSLRICCRHPHLFWPSGQS